MRLQVRHWRRYLVAVAAVSTLVGGLVTVVNAAGKSPAPKPGISKHRSAELAADLRKAVQDLDFADVLDKAPPGTAAARRVAAAEGGSESSPQARREKYANTTAAPIHQNPNLDVTVIELDGEGRPTAAADVLFSPQYPDGEIVPLDNNLSTDAVRWREWDDATWDNNNGEGTVDALPGHEDAPLDFMSPYPASVLKLMVGFGVLRLVDRGAISLDDTYAYEPVGTPSSLCGGARPVTPIRQLFDEMITVSSNGATCALIKLMHDKGYVDELHDTFVDIGLPMLQLDGTNPNTGGTWSNSVIMNSLDTAKLLLAVSGAPGKLWNAPDGTPVTRDVLSESSREFFLAKLHDQGLNQVLSTTNWCGRKYPAPGIPQLTAERWINPTDGTMTVGNRVYGQDVRPCQASAEVTYAHKTGLVDTSGNDAGIVNSLPDAKSRNYIVVVHSNLGDRYVDPNRPPDPPGVYPVSYTEKYGKLGLAIDGIVTRNNN